MTNVERACPFFPIPIDVVQSHVCRYLDVYDLVALMKCSKACLEYFRSDRAFAHIRARIEHHIPPFRKLFQDHLEVIPAKKTVIRPSKSAKKQMVTPHKCIWYIIKTHLFPLTHRKGLQQLIRGLYATEVVLRNGLLWGICDNIETCYASSGIPEPRGDCSYTFRFPKGYCNIRLIMKDLLLINAYPADYAGIPNTHTSFDIMNRCLGLIMGTAWPSIKSPALRALVDTQFEEEKEGEDSFLE